jgi:hypothetical protein
MRAGNRRPAAVSSPPWEAVAVDGKIGRGPRICDRRAVHLLAACLHGTRTVIAQRQVDSKSNELPAFAPCSNSWT